MKVKRFLVGWFVGVACGVALAAWLLTESPPLADVAKYPLTRSPGAVAPYTMAGGRKVVRIECISEAEKDCLPPSVTIPAPGTAGLLLAGLALILGGRP
jgi:hypothetical protein